MVDKVDVRLGSKMTWQGPMGMSCTMPHRYKLFTLSPTNVQQGSASAQQSGIWMVVGPTSVCLSNTMEGPSTIAVPMSSSRRVQTCKTSAQSHTCQKADLCWAGRLCPSARSPYKCHCPAGPPRKAQHHNSCSR